MHRVPAALIAPARAAGRTRGSLTTKSAAATAGAGVASMAATAMIHPKARAR
jgi:hypothetical protein